MIISEVIFHISLNATSLKIDDCYMNTKVNKIID